MAEKAKLVVELLSDTITNTQSPAPVGVVRTPQNYGILPLGLPHFVPTMSQQTKIIRIQGTHLSAKHPQCSGQTLELTNKGACTSMLQGSSVRMPFLLWNPFLQFNHQSMPDRWVVTLTDKNLFAA